MPNRQLSPEAQGYLAAARASAEGLGHPYVSTDHLLYVVVRDADDVVRQFCDMHDLNAAAIGEVVEQSYVRERTDPSTRVCLSTRLERVVQRAVALAGDGAFVRGGHLLLAIIEEGIPSQKKARREGGVSQPKLEGGAAFLTLQGFGLKDGRAAATELRSLIQPTSARG